MGLLTVINYINVRFELNSSETHLYLLHQEISMHVLHTGVEEMYVLHFEQNKFYIAMLQTKFIFVSIKHVYVVRIHLALKVTINLRSTCIDWDGVNIRKRVKIHSKYF